MPSTSDATASAQAIARRDWRLDVSDVLSGSEALEVAATFVYPTAASPRAVLVCLPGGFLTRRYYDLDFDGDRRFSFAQHMARRGFATLALDHLGTGESSRPSDGWVLDAETVARANQLALERAKSRWQSEIGADAKPLGVGHSMGSCLTVVQQACFEPYAALVLFSFTTVGLREFLQGREVALADDPEAARAALVGLARERFGSAYPGDEFDAQHVAFSIGTAPAEATAALRGAATGMLPITGLLSMLPGGYAPWAERVTVPTLVAVGDHDLHGADEARPCLPKASRVDTYTLEDSWHCHNVANTREQLWDHTADWLEDVPDVTN